MSFQDFNINFDLAKLHDDFCLFLQKKNIKYPSHDIISSLDPLEYSALLIELAPFLEEFIVNIFSIDIKLLNKEYHSNFTLIYNCKRKFIQRIALRKYSKNDIKTLITEKNFTELKQKLTEFLGENFSPLDFARKIFEWQENEKENQENLEIAMKYASYMVHIEKNSGILFSFPEKYTDNFLNSEKIARYAEEENLNFSYNSSLLDIDKALNNSHYCIYCHKQEKDYCRKGQIIEDKNFSGCPLNQKISEMHYLKSCGYNIAALAVIMIDNPLVPATGYRICNDCSKSCIYQKQEPVDTPLVESVILDNVLNLPFGAEIYLLFTRWNPLNFQAILPKCKKNASRILIAGSGPSAMALAHYLTNEGHEVVMIESNKIAPLDFDKKAPIVDFKKIKKDLSERKSSGFGGVAEYGITNRWDKNNLTLLRLVLERRENFRLYGGISLNANINLEQVNKSFDYLAVCTGTAMPKFLEGPKLLGENIYSATNFLMKLHLSGFYLKDKEPNMLIELPLLVIGGGLTAFDAAVQALYYYLKQVLQYLEYYEKGDCRFFSCPSNLRERFLSDAKRLKSAKNEQEKKDILRQIGGVKIFYRGQIKNSPAYKTNPEEVMRAIAAGVEIYENFHLINFDFGENKVTKANFVGLQGQIFAQNAKMILVAIGSESSFLNRNIELKTLDSNKIGYFGDCNPLYAGSVVKALASAKYGYKTICQKLKQNKIQQEKFNKKEEIEHLFINQIISIKEITSNILELVIYSPLAAVNFRAGQFFKLQNYEKTPEIKAIALRPVRVEKGYLTFLISVVGRSTGLCREFKSGQRIYLTGPFGDVTNILSVRENIKLNIFDRILLIADHIGNNALLPLAKYFQRLGYKISWIASYNNIKEFELLFNSPEIREVTSEIIFVLPISHKDNNEIILKKYFEIAIVKFSLLDALLYYSKQDFNIHKIVTMMSFHDNEKLKSIFDDLADIFSKTEVISFINASMQCMEGICGSCVIKTKNKPYYSFACKFPALNIQDIDF